MPAKLAKIVTNIFTNFFIISPKVFLTDLCYNMHGDRMKKIIKVNYRSIFKYEEHQETVKYDGSGHLEIGDDKIVVSYQDENKIKIELSENEVKLHNGASVLHLVRDRDILNQYETPYGAIALKTRLISYDNGDNVKIKYELHDGTNLISQVYVMLNYLILEN